MRHIKLFENFNTDYILDIVGELSDTRPNIVSYEIANRSSINGDIILIHSTEIFNPDTSELESAISRLGSIGYKILNTSANMEENTLEDGCNSWYMSIIKTNFYNKLISNNITLWEDLKFKDWHLNKVIGSNAKHVVLNLSENDEDRISILDGQLTHMSEDKIEFNIQGVEGFDEMYFYDSCSAEIALIYIQMDYYGLK
jgi:hypothetical protein